MRSFVVFCLLAGLTAVPWREAAACRSQMCLRIISYKGDNGYSCQMGGEMIPSECHATTEYCRRINCTKTVTMGPGGAILGEEAGLCRPGLARTTASLPGPAPRPSAPGPDSGRADPAGPHPAAGG